MRGVVRLLGKCSVGCLLLAVISLCPETASAANIFGAKVTKITTYENNWVVVVLDGTKSSNPCTGTPALSHYKFKIDTEYGRAWLSAITAARLSQTKVDVAGKHSCTTGVTINTSPQSNLNNIEDVLWISMVD
jgi:hypothetical protein